MMVVGRGRGQGNESLAGGLRGERASDQAHGNSLPLLCPHMLPLSRAADWLWFGGWTGCENTNKDSGSGRVHYLQHTAHWVAAVRCLGVWYLGGGFVRQIACWLGWSVGPIVPLPALLLDSGREKGVGCVFLVWLDQSSRSLAALSTSLHASDQEFRRELLGSLVPMRTQALGVITDGRGNVKEIRIVGQLGKSGRRVPMEAHWA
ncbi:hypothetical protein F4679DRAFT_233287 [Xylaria curta]|nr:hypothetical protein F4679DRAFT_233287 [Xylaria curta]